MSTNNRQSDSAWPHRLAVVCTCVTFPLIWVGGLVTTYKAGMAVPDWPNTFGYNLFLYPLSSWLWGPYDLFIEHGHRLLGALLGILAIALVVVVWRNDSRRWMRWVAVAALLAVISQGVLGGMRVVMDAVQVARIHGCIGPAIFALFAVIACMTSRRWKAAESHSAGLSAVDSLSTDKKFAAKLHRLSLLTALLAYVQLVLGAHLRHLSPNWLPSNFQAVLAMHLFVALALVAHIVLLAVRILLLHRQQRALVRPAVGLLALVLAQVSLGLGTWVVKYGFPVWAQNLGFPADFMIEAGGMLQSMIVTAHVAVGSLILATSAVLVARCWRLVPVPQAGSSLPGGGRDAGKLSAIDRTENRRNDAELLLGAAS